ncbi:leukocyte elastase inhibitor-like [Mercenaria mercenaria]|uniref:leukocyte elastase inhibitor-like n=1 Tax=Mercenaria mercenaria TaxID=6596 RepID=UPI00234E3FFA|nr:leukocyte elastase inhibitor-like [Mercenaria mercenaria]XP_053399176.1 leukocyte elastase inhibitor-like [Mercenaria mercenaria]XP_053399177.1 leukocyte elastase inhibitor-like [Mercenaria mercenaria]
MASPRRDISDCVNEFTLSMYRQITADKPSENIFISPSNVAVVMTMVYVGARKQSEEQMAKTLRLTNMERRYVLQQMERFVEKVEKGSKYITIKTANSLFPHSDKRILEEYVSTVKKYFRTDVKPKDYTSEPDKSRLEINTWVEENTNGKIKDLLPEGALNSLTAMVIVNTLYFKGNWEIPFDSKYTETKDFVKLNGDKVNVRMMRAKKMEDVRYCKNRKLNCKVLKLSYEYSKIGMVIVLPKENDGLLALERKPSLDTLRGLVSGLDLVTADVSLPKFKLESSVQLKQLLSALGMVDVFDMDKADLSGMGNDLFVSEVYHKTFIDVNEEGTEAGAATAAVEVSRSLEETYRFNADHPFLFMIWHHGLDVPLFIGRLLEPSTVAEASFKHKRQRSRTNDVEHTKRRRQDFTW